MGALVKPKNKRDHCSAPTSVLGKNMTRVQDSKPTRVDIQLLNHSLFMLSLNKMLWGEGASGLGGGGTEVAQLLFPHVRNVTFLMACQFSPQHG